MVHRELLQEMEKIESGFDIMNRSIEKKKLSPITDHITNDFAEMLHKRLEQLENHNSKLESDLKHFKDNVKNKYYKSNKNKELKKFYVYYCFVVQ